MNDETKACANCQWWSLVEFGGQQVYYREQVGPVRLHATALCASDKGLCNRRSPTESPTADRSYERRQSPFPTTRAVDVCGDFEPLQEARSELVDAITIHGERVKIVV